MAVIDEAHGLSLGDPGVVGFAGVLQATDPIPPYLVRSFAALSTRDKFRQLARMAIDATGENGGQFVLVYIGCSRRDVSKVPRAPSPNHWEDAILQGRHEDAATVN